VAALTLARVEALAPDQPSLAAAGKLLKPALWPSLGRDATASVLWGEAQGSGSAPYRLSATPDDLGYKCSCPSRKFPCKHVLALFWQFAEHPARFAPADPPPWVSDWLARRRPTAGKAEPPQGAGASAALAVAAADPPAAEDAEEAARAAQRQAKALAVREAGLGQALAAFDTWISDQLREGLASFPQRAQAVCRAAAQRLVDSKAGGLAQLVDELPATLFGLPERLRADFVLGELARLALIAAAYPRQEALPEPLRVDLRRIVGWTQKREDLLADPTAPRLRAAWAVAGTRSVIQADRLRRVETWLAAADGTAALLLDFVPVQVGAIQPPFADGEQFEAELVFYPSSAPLRAIVAERGPSQAGRAPPVASLALGQALAAYHARVAALPWLADDLMLVANAGLRAVGGGLYLAGNDGAAMLPLIAGQADACLPLLGMSLVTAAGIWDGRQLTLLSAQTSLGPWFDPR
jgi:hypothetical protein